MNKDKQQKGQQSTMKSFRLKTETIKLLQELTKKVNDKLNVRLSNTAVLELIIATAAKKGEDWVISQLKNKEN